MTIRAGKICQKLAVSFRTVGFCRVSAPAPVALQHLRSGTGTIDCFLLAVSNPKLFFRIRITFSSKSCIRILFD
jgi:hypothetical protein